ncbi:PTS sugar transporter subunit IIBC [Deltaproteobacteria bacterium]|nr:PTS sugar transporter subunit IIBC [Deltaproteobacteria bacterium]
MIWFRIDNRLIHGQIIEAWLPYTRATHLVVCNESLSHDMLRQQIMLLAVPSRIHVDFVAPVSFGAIVDNNADVCETILVIFANCADAKAAYNAGCKFATLNIGNMHYGPGKRQVCEHVALSEEEAACLHAFAAMDVCLDFRCVPNDITNVTDW